MKLDRIDRRILEQMQRNGRISNLELADAVGLSPTPPVHAASSGWKSPALLRNMSPCSTSLNWA